MSADGAGLSDAVVVELSPAKPTPALDDLLYLQGDEDSDVSVQCRGCDKGGEPVVFYSTHGKSPYDEARVPTARSIGDLFRLMGRHVMHVHLAGT